jgi:hypothetical protein
MLFDLRTDQGEEHDLAADHPELIGQLKQLMDEAHTDSEVFEYRDN